MNCTFLSTVCSTILITEAIYIRKMIFTTRRVRRRWWGWAVLFSVVFWFSVKAESSDSWENKNLMHRPPGPPLNFRLDRESGICHNNLSEDGEWLNWASALENAWQKQSLCDFLAGWVYMWLPEPTSWWFVCPCLHACGRRSGVAVVWGTPHNVQTGLQTATP